MSLGGSPVAPPPSVDVLLDLDTDTWAALLPHVRAALRSLPDGEVTDEVRALRDASTGQLAGGPRRRQLCRLLAGGGSVWSSLQEDLLTAEGLPDEVVALVGGAAAAERRGSSSDADVGGADTETGPPDADRLHRLRTRLREARQERDGWKRRAEGETARATKLERAAADAERTRRQLEQDLEHARAQLATAEVERRRAVERERRRRDRELRELEAELAALRRDEQERRRRRAREQEAREGRAEQDERRARQAERAQGDRPPRVVPGRPTELPPGVAAGTTEAAAMLLDRGRRVVVDGYNVTLKHRGHLDLETQRTWLVRLLATLAARRGVRPVIVFDGQRAGGGRPPAGLRDVEVRFTAEGITADDEIVLAVEGTDEPVVVVTDDRELVARVRVSGADVVSTTHLVGVAS